MEAVGKQDNQGRNSHYMIILQVEAEGQSSSMVWRLFRIMPFWSRGSEEQQPIVSAETTKNKHISFTTMAKATLITRRRLRLNPEGKLFFLYEPGKQVSSAVRIKNVSRSYVAFKFQTNAPKSCYMRPPGGILAPKESILASVAKFIETPDHPAEKKSTKDKFKIVSMKVKQGIEYTPELFEEHKEFVAVESVLQVVFLDPQRPSKELEKLKKRLAEAEAIKQAQKKPQDNKAVKPEAPAEGVIDEWKERREKYLARQQEDIADSF